MLNEYENDIVFAKYLTYMNKALLHKKIDYIRHKEFLNKKEQNLTKEEWVALSIDDDTTHSSFYVHFNGDNNINDATLKKALNTLTKKQRQVIYLNFNKKMTLRRIGYELNITTNAVEKLKMRAIARLRKYLEDQK